MTRTIRTAALLLLTLGIAGFAADSASAGWVHYGNWYNLGSNSRSLGKGQRYDTKMVYLQQGQRIRIWMQSTQLDSFLYLNRFVGAQAYTVAKNDDSWGSFNSYIDFRAQASGYYLIISSTYRPNQFGWYKLWVLVE